MRLRPEEAGHKFCPQTLANDTFETCEGPRCMAWRWHRIPDNLRVAASTRRATRELARPANVPSTWIWRPYDEFEDIGAHWLEPDEECQGRARGYCGLAGTPNYD